MYSDCKQDYVHLKTFIVTEYLHKKFFQLQVVNYTLHGLYKIKI